ncbi:MAG: P63C domain-containing protein [Terracidiphilus sp.]
MANESILSHVDRGAKGGEARAAALTKEERSAIAKRAAESRWSAGILRATHSGDFKIGDQQISAAVLENGKRVLTQESFLGSIGRARKAKAGTGSTALVDGLPPFLQADYLKPFISDELRQSTTPILFRNKKGGKAFGYAAELLPMVCEVYLKLRDSLQEEAARRNEPVKLPRQSAHIILACDMLMRGLARVGIVALVDEATGYQAVRDKDALEKILSQYISMELAKWVKRFPDEFYAQMSKLRGLKYDPSSSKRPMILAQTTLNVVYDRIGPGLTKELQQRRQEIFDTTQKRGKLQQLLTPDVGVPELQHHLSGVTYLAKTFGPGEWEPFLGALDKVTPRYNRTLMLPFPEDASA